MKNIHAKQLVYLILFFINSNVYSQGNTFVEYINLLNENNLHINRKLSGGFTSVVFQGIKSGNISPLYFNFDTKEEQVVTLEDWQISILFPSYYEFENNLDFCYCDDEEDFDSPLEYLKPNDIYFIAIDFLIEDNIERKKYIHFYFPPYHYDNIKGKPFYLFSIYWDNFISYLISLDKSEPICYKNTSIDWWKKDVFLPSDYDFCESKIINELIILSKTNNDLLLKNHLTGKSVELDPNDQYFSTYSLMIKRNKIKKIIFELLNYERPVNFIEVDWRQLKKSRYNIDSDIPYAMKLSEVLENNDYYADSTIGKVLPRIKTSEKSPSKNRKFSFMQNGYIYLDMPVNKKINQSLIPYLHDKILNNELSIFEGENNIDKEKYLADLSMHIHDYYNYVMRKQYYQKPIALPDSLKEKFDQEGMLFYVDIVVNDDSINNAIQFFNCLHIENEIVFDSNGNVLSSNPKNFTIVLPHNHPMSIKGIDIPICSIEYQQIMTLLKKEKRHLYKALESVKQTLSN